MTENEKLSIMFVDKLEKMNDLEFEHAKEKLQELFEDNTDMLDYLRIAFEFVENKKSK